MLEKIKFRLGIADAVKIYDADITAYIQDAKSDMIDSGVPPDILGDTPD